MTDVKCPKCQKMFSQDQVFYHYQSCNVNQKSFVWHDDQAVTPIPKESSSKPLLIKQQSILPVHQHSWIESDIYKVCLGCNKISPKLKGLWFLYVRYFFALTWILLFIGFLIGRSI